ncbi:hypothetical protein [Stenotrophomonas maltophilia]|uniref:hypothetical protein n=1 Tax=Stenotrophomonas maltophilia TaxID=40324 RepID=UPI0040428440
MSRVDVLVVMGIAATTLHADNYSGTANSMDAARVAVAEVFAAARASLDARDLADQLAADEWLERALAACDPIHTDHNREAVDGLCVEENDDE